MRRFLLLLTAALLGLPVSGCEGVRHVDHFPSHPGLDEDSVDLGLVDVGSSSEHLVTLRNEGLWAFGIGSVKISPDSDPSFSVTADAQELERGGSAPLKVRFQPLRPGFASAVARVELTGDVEVDAVELQLSGMGADPNCLPEVPNSLDLGTVTPGTTESGSVAIANRSQLDWRVTVGTIQGETDLHGFAFAGFAVGEHTVPRAGELVIPIEFTSGEPGVHRASFDITIPGYWCRRSVALVATVAPAQ